MLKSEME